MTLPSLLVTGGAGYIGSHCVARLVDRGYPVVIVDNFSNSSPAAVTRLEALTDTSVTAIDLDIRDTASLVHVLRAHGCEAVVHFAGLKAVGESVEHPIRYYANNVAGTVSLVEAMLAARIVRLVFSSSCTVYGTPDTLPVTETAPCRPENPYGRTKLGVETLLADVARSDPAWKILSLRYFNPVGAHPSGLIGEDPRGLPNNLMPFIMGVAVGRYPRLNVFGNDYPTRDGTCIRDYIHVCDLADGHVAALDALDGLSGMEVVNLGTGTGYSVLEILAAAEEVVGRPIPFAITGRRSGDSPATYADPSRALEALGWRATRDLHDMCRDHWNWQHRNPNGYHRP